MATPQVENYQLTHVPNEETSRKKERHSNQRYRENLTISIPLIAKRMNFVEKYIKEFGERTEKSSRVRNKNYANLTERQSVNRSISPQDDSMLVKQFCSIEVPAVEEVELKPNNPQSCIKYSTIRDQSSEERIQSLGKVELQYLKLKQKAHLSKQAFPSIANSKRAEIANTISHEQVERQIKKSIINQGGQRYFADLYLMKKGRDKIITSLSTVGKHTLGNLHDRSYQQLIKNSLTYQDQVATSKHDYVKKKILDERNVKKDKMLRGKSMNWNVYYDMLALSTRERKKLKGSSKFEADYGMM